MYFKMNEEEECPICLVIMNEEEGILIMDCCGKKVHLACIVTWYTEQSTHQTCFLCNQTNKFCQSILAPNYTSPHTSRITNQSTPTNDSRSEVNQHNIPHNIQALATLETSLVSNPNLELLHRFPCLLKYGQHILVFGSVISFLGIACILTIYFTVIK